MADQLPMDEVRNERLDRAIDALLARRDSQPIVADVDVYSLVEIGAALREMPREEYRAELKKALDGAASASAPKVDPVRSGFRTLTPYLPVKEVNELIEFMTKAYGAGASCTFATPTGAVHAEIALGDSMVMVGGGREWSGTPMPTSLWLFVPDVDATYASALRAGATSIYEPMDQPYGDRDAGVTDLAGNQWFISTHKAAPGGGRHAPEGLHGLNLYLHPERAVEFAEFTERAFGAEIVERHAAPDGTLAHAKIRIGSSVMGLSEARGQFPNMPTMIYMYVPDVDAAYKQAVAAGAEALTPVTEQAYGDRNGMVRDAWGNRWYIASRIREP